VAHNVQSLVLQSNGYNHVIPHHLHHGARLKLRTTDLKRVGSEKTDISNVSTASTSKIVRDYGMEYDPNGSRANSMENQFVQPQSRLFRNGLTPIVSMSNVMSNEQRHRYPSSSMEVGVEMDDEERRRIMEEEDDVVDDEIMDAMRHKFQRSKVISKRESTELIALSLKSPPLPPLDDSGQETSDSDSSMYKVY